MAVVASSVTEIRAFGEKAHVITWTPIPNGDSGAPIEMPGSATRSIQFGGTFGVGGTVVLEGSNDGTTYFTLTDLQTTAISKTAAALEGIAELTRYVRPRVTAGDGDTAISAYLVVRRTA